MSQHERGDNGHRPVVASPATSGAFAMFSNANSASQLPLHSNSRSTASVSAVSYEVIRRSSDEALVINPTTGTWALLNEGALNALERMDGTALRVLEEQLGVSEEKVWEFVQELYAYGLVTIDGNNKYSDPNPTNFPLALLVLKLTNACNLWCKYCYNEGLDAAAGGIPIETALLAVDSALDSCENGVNIVLHGGEPLLQFKRIQQIVEYAERKANELSKEVYFSLQTNATLLNTENVSYIKAHRIGLGVSFDGPEVINDEVRIWKNGRGSALQILDGIELLKANGVAVNIITVVTKHNARRLCDIAQYLQSLGCRTVKFSYFFPQGRGDLFRELTPDPEDIVYSLKAIVQNIVTGALKAIEVEDIISFVDNIVLHNKQSMCHRSPCGAGKDMMTVFPSGKIYACDCLVHPDFYLGDISSTSLRQAARHIRLQPLGERVVERLLPCNSCALQRICGGTMTCRAFWNSQTVNTMDSSECFVNQSLIEHLMWTLMDSPMLLEYYRGFKQTQLVRPINYA